MTPNSLVLFADAVEGPIFPLATLAGSAITALCFFILVYDLLPIKSKVVKIIAASIIPIVIIILAITIAIKDNHVDHPKPYGLYQFMPENELKED